MRNYILVNMGNGVVSLCERVADFDGEGLGQLRMGITSLIGEPAIDTRESRTASEDSSSTSLDPVDSPPEDE